MEIMNELRSTSATRYYPSSSNLLPSTNTGGSPSSILDGAYKTPQLVADTRDIFQMSDDVPSRMWKEVVGE